MSRHRAGRRSSRAFTIVAIVIAAFLVISSLVVLLPVGTGDDEEDDTSASVQVTPGAEVARLETAVARNPDDVDAMAQLAEILANSGRVDESIPWFERAVTARPDDADLRLAFGMALDRAGNDFDAEVHLRRAAELDPADNAAAFYLGRLYENASPPRIDDARDWYQRAIDIDPDSVIAEQARQQLATLDASAATPTAVP